MTDELYLPQRSAWMHRSMFRGLPVQPTTGDRGPVRDAIVEIVDAAGGLENSRRQLDRAIAMAQKEFDDLRKGPPDLGAVDGWSGVSTPVVYYEFAGAVTWTRTVKDRYDERLIPAVAHDPELRRSLRKIRKKPDLAFDDARLLAKVGLHKYNPPYPHAGAKVVGGGRLIYRVPKITAPDDFRENLRSLSDDRHAISVADEFWSAVTQFIEDLLGIFYRES